jgi:hypothetical protein
VRRALLAALAVVVGLVAAAPASAADRCDPIDPSRCLYPWPNDYFRKDGHLALTADMMPVNASGAAIEPSDYNWSDGFSPGAPIVTKVPGLDTPAAFAKNGVVPVTDVARSFDSGQPVLVINERTLRRQLIWAELDSNATSPANTALLIHPAKNLREGERYILVLRNLRAADGTPLQSSPAFRRYRDRIKTTSRAFERRRPHMEHIFKRLKKAGVKRSELYVAWDFTVASARSLSSRMRGIRDDAFRGLGDTNLLDLKVSGESPKFSLTKVTLFNPCGSDGCQAGEDDIIQRRVEGTVEVPCYLDQPGCPAGSRFKLGANGQPLRTPGNVYNANFICNIPRSVTSQHPGRLSLYGHGLFGSAAEVNSISRLAIASEHRVVLCASDWIGMSGGDIPNTISILQDLSKFPSLADRLQQGFLDFLFLGRTMIHPHGFKSSLAFWDPKGPLIDTRHLYYSGGSQGGIAGGALTAVAPDFTRSVLIVPAMNYSLLLTRSIDFDPFAQVLYPAYPDELIRPLVISLIQTLWDRGDPDGYAWHMTDDPYPNTPAHTVLLHMAVGDHQVANVATEVEARTIGARLRLPAVDPGRSTEVEPFYGIRPITNYPYNGSALVVWDIGPLRPPGCSGSGCVGTPTPPIGNTAPRLGVDPHGLTGREVSAQLQFSRFIDGAFVDVCGLKPCYAQGWTGP